VRLRTNLDRFFRYFRTYDPDTRQLVARRFYAVSGECAGETKRSTVFCSDEMRLCQSDYVSVTYGNSITNCNIFWRLPLVTDQCHGYDQASILIHETSHVDGVFDPSTVDFKDNYGWPRLTYLSPEQALTNADNYQFYANGESLNDIFQLANMS
jgi:deuterolysin